MGQIDPDDDEKTDPGPCACSGCRMRLLLRERMVEARVTRFTSVETPAPTDGNRWTVYLQRDGSREAKGVGSTEESAIDLALRVLTRPT